MRNILHIWKSEMKLVATNIITALIVLGLVIMPSLFTWYNVLACWDVFSNTGELSVAVANSDDGFESDLLPVKVNIGDVVVDALRENDSINWVFVDEDEALDGTASGKYYAAVVIPENFSESMLTFYQEDTQSTELTYYSNEKINAISPKIVGQGASLVSYTVNEEFAETVSDIALSIVESASTYLDSEGGAEKLADLSERLGKVADRADQIADVLSTYSQVMSSSQKLLSSSAGIAHSLESDLDTATGYFSDASETAVDIKDALVYSLDSMDAAIDSCIEAIEAIVDADYSADGASAEKVAQKIREQKASVDTQVEQYSKILTELQKDPDANAGAIKTMELAINELKELSSSLEATAQKIEDGTVATDIDELKEKAREALSALQEVRNTFTASFRADLSEFSDKVDTFSAATTKIVSAMSGKLDAVGDDLTDAGYGVVSAKSKIDTATTNIYELADKIRTLSDGLDDALSSGDMDTIRAFLSNGVDTLSSALAAPVSVERTAVYPSENFGSSMYPLYVSLALFIGALLSMVLLKPRVAQRVIDEFPEDKKPTSRQRFLGHFGIIAVISLAQSTVLGIGSIFFLGVQAMHPLLFMLCLWVSGLVLSVIMYMLVASFANLGKAVGVLLLIVQVTGCGGSYPLAILPQFVQDVSVWLPAYHIVNALRAAMFGLYGNDFWVELGIVVLFAIPVIAAAMIFNKPFAGFSAWYMNKAAKSKLLS